MLIALLAVLGVNWIVIVVLFTVMLTRRRWVSRQAGAFKGAIRVVEGEVPGLRVKWTRGYGRWVRDILVWTKAPFLFRNELVAADARSGEVRMVGPHGVKRLGKNPVIIRLAADGGARIEIAASQAGHQRAPWPLAAVPGIGAGPVDAG